MTAGVVGAGAAGADLPGRSWWGIAIGLALMSPWIVLALRRRIAWMRCVTAACPGFQVFWWSLANPWGKPVAFAGVVAPLVVIPGVIVVVLRRGRSDAVRRDATAVKLLDRDGRS